MPVPDPALGRGDRLQAPLSGLLALGTGTAVGALAAVWLPRLERVWGVGFAPSLVLVAALGAGGLLAATLTARGSRPLPALAACLFGLAGTAALLAGLGPDPLVSQPSGARLLGLAVAVGVPACLAGATPGLLVADALGRGASPEGAAVRLGALALVGGALGVGPLGLALALVLGDAATEVAGALAVTGLGGLALWASRRDAPAGAAPRAASGPGGPEGWRAWAAAAGLGGVLGVHGLAWERTLLAVLGDSAPVAAGLAALAALGVGCGGLALRQRGAAHPPERLLEVGFAVLGCAVWIVGAGLSRSPEALLALIAVAGPTPAGVASASAALGALTVLPSTVVSGALLAVLYRTPASGRWPAAVTTPLRGAALLLGGAAGGALALLLIPPLGLALTVALASAACFALAAALSLGRAGARARLAGFSVAAAVAVALPLPWDPEVLTSGAHADPHAALYRDIELAPLEGREAPLLYYAEGGDAIVSVHAVAGRRALRVDGRPDASDARDLTRQVVSAHAPLLFGAPASSALLIGFQSGITAGSLALYPLERIDSIALAAAVPEASRHFEPGNGRPLDDPRLRPLDRSPRAWLHAARARYDVVICAPPPPWYRTGAALFTREHFRAVREALRGDGRLLQILPLYGSDERALAATLAAMAGEFPYLYGLAVAHRAPELLVLATLRPLRRGDLPRWEGLPRAVRSDLERVHVYSSEDLWSLVRLLPPELARLREAAAGEVNRDGHRRVELRAPLTRDGARLAASWRSIDRFALGVLPLLDTGGPPLDAESTARLALAYATYRRDAVVAVALLGLASRRGEAAAAAATRVELAHRLLSPEERAERLDAALAAAPADCPTLLMRAEALLELPAFERALADADRCLALRAADPRARMLRALALKGAGRGKEAAVELDALLSASAPPWDPVLLRAAARVYLQPERLADAARALEQLLEHDPEDAESWETLARAYEALGQPEAAGRARRDRDTAQANRLRRLHREARRAAWSGERALARRILQDVLASDPDYEAARSDLDALAGR